MRQTFIIRFPNAESKEFEVDTIFFFKDSSSVMKQTLMTELRNQKIFKLSVSEVDISNTFDKQKVSIEDTITGDPICEVSWQ